MMGLDFWMEIDAGGKARIQFFEAGYTDNVAEMFYDTIELPEGIRDLNGMDGEQAKPYLEKALFRMIKDPDKYKQMEPSNGFGSYYGAKSLLDTLIGWCNEAPKAILMVS